MRKALVLLGYVFIALSMYMFEDSLLQWVRQGGTDYLFLTAILATFFALFPIIPYPLIGGVLGAAYGPIIGSLVTWIGSALASIIMFSFVRYGYQDWGQKWLYRYDKLSKVTILFERNAFMTIFLTRLIPVMPSIIVNIYSALSRVTFVNYTIASSLGKVPSMILFAVVGNSIVSNPRDLLYISLFYGVFLLIVYALFRLFSHFSSIPKEKLPD
ncbi:TVP38/TMEM64 family protein [Halalkalibacter nanhaiisediminis]|uniref:TVP38/TMEM64 family membrane protein n=1 Tax=Halalkalibacter nanhaiisediminis TaxID=688079 RepID=A0A562QR95_9BACI|nr:TVP38/TMEM64 family protein [Halalkalibacter nanhaiisediminis]TWI59271.1 putative membrane protein YdjX (TVP38/TMEM64 family) [Halalkalibacter nanhaiisediminis]